MNPLKSEGIFDNPATLVLPVNTDDSVNYTDLEKEFDAKKYYLDFLTINYEKN